MVGRSLAEKQQCRERIAVRIGKRIEAINSQRPSLGCLPPRLKQLWTEVAELLGDAPMELEREALAIPPAEEER